MITSNIIFNLEVLKKENWICLGTPLQLRLFCNNYPKVVSCNQNNIKIKI